MKGAAVRSRLLMLRRQLTAATTGHDLLERKLEVLLRETLRRAARRDRQRARAATRLAVARQRLADACTDAGRRALGAAALAQPETASLERRDRRLVGVTVPSLRGRFERFTPCYGPASTTASMDAAGAAFADTLPVLVRLAEQEMATAALTRALARTVRRLNALEKIVIPTLRREIYTVTDALEEEERDESVRRRHHMTRLRGRR